MFSLLVWKIQITVVTTQKLWLLLYDVFEFHTFTRVKDNATANVGT